MKFQIPKETPIYELPPRELPPDLQLFRAASSYVRSEMNYRHIHKVWQESEYGRLINEKGFKRYLQKANHETRNIYFEPFLLSLALELLLERKLRLQERWDEARWLDPEEWKHHNLTNEDSNDGGEI